MVSKALHLLKDFLLVTSRGCCTRELYYFCDLSLNNIPSSSSDCSSDCILGWYIRWPGRRRDVKGCVIQSLMHVSVSWIVQIMLSTIPSPTLNGKFQQLRFFLCLRHFILHSGVFSQASLVECPYLS